MPSVVCLHVCMYVSSYLKVASYSFVACMLRVVRPRRSRPYQQTSGLFKGSTTPKFVNALNKLPSLSYQGLSTYRISNPNQCHQS